MPRVDPTLRDNPVRRCRKEMNLTLHDLSRNTGVNYQAIFLNECGTYPEILPALLSYFIKRGYYSKDLRNSYSEFVLQRRRQFARNYDIRLPEVDATENVITTWRHSLGLTKMSLAKELCVRPDTLARVESGKAMTLPSQLAEALRDIGFDVKEVNEFNDRISEFHLRIP